MRKALKLSANLAAFVAMLPCLAAYWSMACLAGSRRVFPGWSQAVSLFPGLSGDYLRRAFYQRAISQCGSGSVVSFGTVFSHASISLGENVYIGVFCGVGDVTIEDDVLIGSHVSITNGSRQHGTTRLDIPVREQPGEWPRVTIGTDTWIGERAIVMADVGRHCVVGAGAVVTKRVPDYAIVVGSPARIVGDRRDQARSSHPAEERTDSVRGRRTQPSLPTDGRTGI